MVDDETLFSQCPVVSGWVFLFSVFYRNLFLYLFLFLSFFLYFFLLGCGREELSSAGFMFREILYSAPSLVVSFCPGCSLFVVFFNFGLSGFRPEFVIFSFLIHYGQLSPRLVSVLGLDRCFQSDSLLYLVFGLYSYWPFVFHPSVDVMPCAFRPASIGLK